MSDNSLALMLDGLDEVAEDRRNDTVVAINYFLKQGLGVPVAVCCREKEYAALRHEVTTSGALFLLPLSGKQIEDYLQKNRRRCSGKDSVFACTGCRYV